MPRRIIPHLFLPNKRNEYLANWLVLERIFNQQLPVCVTATGDPGTIANGAPGAESFVIWQPTTIALNDRDTFIGIVATSSLRVPADGYYSFWMMWYLNQNLTDYLEFKTFMDTADTSLTGFGSPSWSRAITGPSRGFDNTHETIDRFSECEYRGVELHANDLVRFGCQVVTTEDITGMTVVGSEFRFLYPVPSQGT